MLRTKLVAGALALVSAMICAQSRAAAPTLPPDVIGADAVAVVHVDVSHFNPDGLQAAATAILGQNAVKMDDQLKKFKAKYDAATGAGVRAVTVVIAAQNNADGGPPPARAARIVYFELKPGADVDAIKTMITSDMGPDEKGRTTFDSNGNFLAMHDKDQPLPAKADADKTAMFVEALGSISDVSVKIAMIPNAEMHAQMGKIPAAAPKGAKDAGPLLAKSKWFAFGITLSNDPSVTATAAQGSPDDARALADAITSTLADVKAMVANPDPNGPPLALFAPIINQIADSLKPTPTGSRVTVGLKGPVLSAIANMAMNFGMNFGGGPGGGLGGAPAPR